MRIRKRVRSIALALSMIMILSVLLSGCKGQEGKTPETVAKGRYIEESIAFPEEWGTKEWLFTGMTNIGTDLYLYGIENEMEGGAGICYLLTADGWVPQETNINILGRFNEGEILTVQRQEDGKEYLTVIDWSSYNEETNIVNSEIIEFSAEGIQDYRKDLVGELDRPDWCKIMPDGSILFSQFDQAIYFSADGNKFEILQGGGVTSLRTLRAVSSEYYVVNDAESKNLLRYDLKTGTVVETIPMPAAEFISSSAMTLDDDGNIYLVNENGIQYWTKDGSIWEVLADGALNSLSMPSIYMREIFLGADNDYYTFVSSDSALQLLHFTYDENIASVPTHTLSIYGLNDSPTVRQAISVFQNLNPDIRVDFQVADGGTGNATVTDTIKALNTELLNKKGADIILLDGLPIEDYIEKGVLADISDWLSPMLSDGTLTARVAGNYQQESGEIYAVPLRFILPIAFGSEEGFEAISSLEKAAAYAPENTPLLQAKNHMEILRFLINGCYDELFGADEDFSTAKLELLLTAVKKIHDAGDREEIRTGTYGSEIYNYQSEYGFSDIDGIFAYSGQTNIAVEELRSVHDIMMLGAYLKQMDVEPKTLNGIYFPVQIAGINQATKQMDLAKEFMELLLSYEIQNMEFYDGFPVNQQANDQWKVFRDENTMVGSSYTMDDGSILEITAVWPEPEMQQKILGLQEELTTPVNLNKVLMEMIEDEAAAYFEGNIEVEQAAAAIADRAALYFAE